MRARMAVLVMGVAWMFVAEVSAQVLGNFAWQMQPYCNVVTATLTRTPAGFTVDGTDDQCGSADKASVVGTASFNASGLVNVNFTIVTAPSGKAVHVAAIVNSANGNGTWTDSVGNSGTFALGVATGGSPRPLPASGIGASVITTAEIATGAVGGSDINTAEVQARVTGTCPAGQSVSRVNADGTVVCQSNGDQAGGLKRVTHGIISVPTSAVSYASAADLVTLTFTSPVNGTALIVGRGYCNVTTALAPASGGSLLIGIAVAGESALSSLGDWVALRVPATNPVGFTASSYFTERAVPVVAGEPQIVAVKAYRDTFWAESANCAGSARVTIHPSTLP